MNKKTAKERLLMLIEKEADSEGQWADRLTEVAQLLGVNRRTVQRALRALEREGKITAVAREPRKPVRYQLIRPTPKGDTEGGTKDGVMSPHQVGYEILNPWAVAPEARRQDVMGGAAALPDASFPSLRHSSLENFPVNSPYGWSQGKGDTLKATSQRTFLGIPKDVWVKVGICVAGGGLGALCAKYCSDDPSAPLWGVSMGIIGTALAVYILDQPSPAPKPSLPTANEEKKPLPRGDFPSRLIEQLARLSAAPSPR